MTWRDYHEITKHTAESLRRNRHYLDWANMPNPFRQYEGVPLLDLPADPPVPVTPALEVLLGAHGPSPGTAGPEFLSELFFYSAAISASKQVPSTGSRYALRVNPSSGNLHPTEFHFRTQGLADWPDGLYHYRSDSHMAEQRASGEIQLAPASSAPLTLILTSIAWREAWKYQDRAYRYCLHDIGHAWQAVALAARAMGCDTFATGDFPDDEVAHTCRLHDDEWPMLMLEIRGHGVPTLNPGEANRRTGKTVWYGGQANSLSSERVAYARIDQIHQATKARAGSGTSGTAPPPPATGEVMLPPLAKSPRPFGETARMRRSALDFEGGPQSISLPQLSALLAATAQPLQADFGEARFIDLYLYIHRVEGLEPGVYRYWSEPAALERIRSGDQRVAAAGLSLGQDLAGNACVAFSMIGDLARAAHTHGDRGYRYVYFEAGAIGQRLYLAAEALGLGATGIGAFYDEQVHSYLDVARGQGQVVYHFAIGYPVPDPRLDAHVP